ncbi:MAG: hypothetical protein U0R19_08930 [Bryobacteraceae bacterium]
MDLFEAIEEIYGVSSVALKQIGVKRWERPEAIRVREHLLSYYSEDNCRAQGYEHYPYARIAAICPIRQPSKHLPKARSVASIGVNVPRLAMELLAEYTAPLHAASLWDAETYRLIDFEPEEPRAAFAIDSFLRFRLTTGLMREELYRAIARGMTTLSLREQIAPDAAALVDFKSHSVCGGVHTLCAFARPAPYNDFVIPLQRRSLRVAVAGGSYGVIPMAFHQPYESGHLDAREPATTAVREIFEELFGGEESHEEARFLTHPAIEWLLSHEADLHFETTNLFVSLFGGNYDFSLLMAVTNTDFWQRFGPCLETGWESGEHFLLSSQDKVAWWEILRECDWEAQALGCCLDGLRRLRVLHPARMLNESYDAATC